MKVVIAKYNSNACDESEILSAIEEYFGGDANRRPHHLRKEAQ